MGKIRMRPNLLLCAFLVLTLACREKTSSTADTAPQPPNKLPASSQPDSKTGPTGPEQQTSEKSRGQNPKVDPPDEKAFIEANTDFSFTLYQHLRTKGGNIFYCPHSISLALAMTYAGAQNTTATQIAQAMHFELKEDKLHTAFNWLAQELDKRNELPPGEQGMGFVLKVANGLWSKTGSPLEKPFLDTLAVSYGTAMRFLDFVANPEASRSIINSWVKKRTEGKIKDLIPPRTITPNTELVLTNVVYFLAPWEHSFKEKKTSVGPFRISDGTTVDVPMMQQTKHLSYAETATYQAVKLPYNGRQLSMVLFLPKEGELKTFEDDLSGETFRAALDQLKPTRVQLTMPRFELESSAELSESLKAIGMVDAFNPNTADFKKMSPSSDLCISAIHHKGYIKVDEQGTEAAAATAVVISRTSLLRPPTVMTLNRTFLFGIVDKPTGAVLFVGRVANPSP
jgi:serpin B